jgi:hypothetical protein
MIGHLRFHDPDNERKCLLLVIREQFGIHHHVCDLWRSDVQLSRHWKPKLTAHAEAHGFAGFNVKLAKSAQQIDGRIPLQEEHQSFGDHVAPTDSELPRDVPHRSLLLELASVKFLPRCAKQDAYHRPLLGL